jgi:hypothetical protein
MKNFRNILASVAAAFMCACSGNVDDSSLPVLTASMEEVDLANGEKVTFTVTYNGQDVTSEAVISDVLSSSTSKLPAPEFTPEREGTYLFIAEYNGKLSNTVTVEVINTTPVVVESKYERNVCLVEFTGAWCINCPDGYDKLMGVLSKPSMTKYKDRIHMCAFHSNLEGTDSLGIPATQDLIKCFTGMAYPSFTTDLRESGVLTSDGISLLQPSLMASFNDYPAHCGVAVSSVLNADKTSAEVAVKVASENTGGYRVIVLVLQNKIQGWQKTTDYPEGDNNYYHNHVVRDVVTSYAKTFAGEKITEDGKITAGDEASKTWTVAVDPEWVLENTEIYAIVQDKSGMVNNMNLCPVDGGDSGYMLK